MLSTCYTFIRHLWFCLLSASFVCFPIKAFIFSLMIYKSFKCTCFPEARPSCAGTLSGCYADVPVVGPVSMATDTRVSMSRERVAMAMLSSRAWPPLPFAEQLFWPQGCQPRQRFDCLPGRRRREAHALKQFSRN